MAVRLKPLGEQVVVITGASSGIGLVTARMAARRGARLVLAARNEAALRQLAEEVRAAGGEATHHAADVGDEEQVRGITRAAVEKFGGFDTWINNAGAAVYGKLLDVASDDHRKLFDTNFWGVVHGSLEAARHLRQRGGAIINVGSELSDRAMPVIGMYSATKHAVKGFTDALRIELEADELPISVSLVKPSATDTPFAEHGKNYLDREPTLPAPLYAPEVAAEAILHCSEHPTRDIFAGGRGRLHALQGQLAPRLSDWVARTFFMDQRSKRPARRADDALHRPTTGLRERGRSEGRRIESSLYTQAAMHPVMSGVVAVGASLAVAALLGAAADRSTARKTPART